MGKNSFIEAINKAGQSIWYDNLSRAVLRSGELKSLLDAGVSGLTSNPTIFKKAIADSTDYDVDLKPLASQGMSSDEICETLMVGDVGEAADLLRSIFDSTKGGDGHASIEVSPTLARDTKGTIEAGKRLWKRLNRPNIMIKVPATTEGLPAIRALLEEGINVNVTLIFSAERYAEVAEAYISALETRHKQGKAVGGIASVASFFVSRVDALCEKKFEEAVKAGRAKESDKAEFFGKIGIANSRCAYQKFKEIFGGPRFAKLIAAGARVQRPLWASTGTKNPAFSPVLYVEALAGENTVNTVPPDTLKAIFKGVALNGGIESGSAEAARLVGRMGALGVNLSEVLRELESAGVSLFADSYRELVDSIEKKKAKV